MEKHGPRRGQPTVELTAAQAVVMFLQAQWSERDGWFSHCEQFVGWRLGK